MGSVKQELNTAHGVSGVDWRFYKHPLPKYVFDSYMKHWGMSTCRLMRYRAECVKLKVQAVLSEESSLMSLARLFIYSFAAPEKEGYSGCIVCNAEAPLIARRI